MLSKSKGKRCLKWASATGLALVLGCSSKPNTTPNHQDPPPDVPLASKATRSLMSHNSLQMNGVDNGLYVNGLSFNGATTNGLYVNGLPVNGLPVNGLPLNGLPLNGLYVNGLYVNGLYVNGSPLTDVGLDGLYVNGTDAATAIKIASPNGELVDLSSNQIDGFQSMISHMIWCAAPQGTNVSIFMPGKRRATNFPGYHGLAPEWKLGGLVDDPNGIDGSEKVRWCMEHYRAADSNNDIYEGIALNDKQLADLEVLLKYAIECALNPGDSVDIEFPSGPITFHGALGLAPGWKDGALDSAGQRGVSACLGARTNAYGTTVRISLRHPDYPELSVSAAERENFPASYAILYGTQPGQIDRPGSCVNTGYGNAFCTLEEVTDDPDVPAMLLWLVAPDGDLLGQEPGRPFELPLWDSHIAMQPMQDSPRDPIGLVGVWYDGVLERDGNLRIRYGFNGWQNVQELGLDMSSNRFSVQIPSWAQTMEFALRSGDRWDNNRGRDFRVHVRPWVQVRVGAVIDGVRDVSLTYQNDRFSSAVAVYGQDGWRDVQSVAMEAPFYFPTRYTAETRLPAQAKTFDVAFTNGDGEWDNNNNADYHFDLDTHVLW
ncbi:MAG: hypothetical protein IPK13_07875 [Deltaproteobacteria bacterium]|nr:hypothetical protein [Deltaproteobacteria bacterium]